MTLTSPFAGPSGLRRRSAAASLLRSWVRIPPGAWMFVCCECCVLSGRGFCDKLITRPEESYWLWCVFVCDLETSRMRRPWPALGRSATAKKKKKFKNTLQIFATRGRLKTNLYREDKSKAWEFFVKGFRGDTEFGIPSSKRKEPLTTKHSSNWI